MFIVNCVFFFKRLCCKCFPCHCLHSSIMRPKFETHAHSEFHVCFLLYFSFFQNPVHIQGVPYKHEQVNLNLLETQYICKMHPLYIQHICYFCPVQKTELKLLSSIQTTFLSNDRNVVSPRHQSHCQLSSTFSCHARSVSTPPCPTGSTCFKGATARSEASFVNGCVTDV